MKITTNCAECGRKLGGMDGVRRADIDRVLVLRKAGGSIPDGLCAECLSSYEPKEKNENFRARSERNNNENGKTIKPTYCSKCGAKIVDGAIFCISCGQNIKEIKNELDKKNIIQQVEDIVGDGMPKCKQCGANVGSFAEVCPKCGQKNPQVSDTAKMVIFFVIFCFGIGVWTMLNRACTPSEETQRNMKQLEQSIEDFQRRELRREKLGKLSY